jgi:hypothetical protein
MMKKFIYGILALVLLVAAVYTVWVQFPKIKNPQLAQAIYKDATARHEALLADAEDPAKNGYLNPAFLPYWGRKGTEQDPNAHSAQTMKAWSTYSSSSQGVAIDHEKLQAEEDKNYLAALEHMKKLSPELIHASGRPIFFAPNSTLDFGSMVPNLINIRASAQAMTGLAAAYTAEGDLPNAVECLLAPLRIGHKLQGQGALISDMIGIALQALATDGMFGLLDINGDMPADQWKHLAQSLLDEAPRKDLLAIALEGEMTMARNTLELYRQGTYQGDMEQMDLLPGFLSREERIYVNTMTDCISQVKNGGSLTMPSYLTNASTYDWVSGKTGVLVQIMFPNFTRAGQQADLSRHTILAAATAYGIAAYRATEGELPNELSQLTQAGIPLTDDAKFLSGVDWKVTGDSATLKIKILDSGSSLTWASGQFWENPWLQSDNEFAIFLFKPTQ